MNKKYVKVKWHDASGLASDFTNEWMNLDDAKEQAEIKWKNFCETCGWVIFENKNYIIIATTKTAEDFYSDLTMIPKSLIIKSLKLK